MGLDVGQVRDPETVRRVGHEVTIDEVTRSVQRVVADGRHFVAASLLDAGESHLFHESLDGAACDAEALATQLLPDLLGAVDTVEAGVVDPLDLGL